jgi:hypothetical protein
VSRAYPCRKNNAEAISDNHRQSHLAVHEGLASIVDAAKLEAMSDQKIRLLFIGPAHFASYRRSGLVGASYGDKAGRSVPHDAQQ